MSDFLLRLILVFQVLVPFVFFMASVYLALHLLVVSLARRPDSPLLWFFRVVTGPLTRPVRAFAPAQTSESRSLAIALAVYVTAWLGSRALISWLGWR